MEAAVELNLLNGFSKGDFSFHDDPKKRQHNLHQVFLDDKAAHTITSPQSL
jgi:hypothetical protein